MQFLYRLLIAIVVISSLVGGTRADVVVPNYAATTEADNQFFLFATALTGRTYQMMIHSSQLTSVVGQNITGFQIRLNGAATSPWPPTDANFSFFNVTMGAGIDPATFNVNFADNFSGTPVSVRSGPITFLANSFSSGGSPNAFGPSVLFDTPYLYTGGHLTVELRFSNMTGNTTLGAFDAVSASGGPANGYGVDFRARWTSNATATASTGNGNFIVANFLTQPVPEPSSAAVLLVGLMSLVYRRRR